MHTAKKPKKLLCFAHRREAQSFLQSIKLQSTPDPFEGFWRGEDLFLLITGEGLQNATEKTTAILAIFNEEISQVVNFGVAGALNEKLAVGDLLEVRTSYLYQGEALRFRSFSAQGAYDCVSCFDRIADGEKAKKLTLVGDLVDRELWGIASSCQLFNKPFTAVKVISDRADQLVCCQAVQEKTLEFSEKFYDWWLKQSDEKKERPRSPLSGDFYFTLAMKHQYEDLLRKLQNLHAKNEDEILALADYQELIKTPMPAKIRALRLLQNLNRQLNPMQELIEKNLAPLTKSLERSQINLTFPLDYETDELRFSFSATSMSDFQEKIQALQNFPLTEVHKVLRGELDV
jgi:hypothetical protein